MYFYFFRIYIVFFLVLRGVYCKRYFFIYIELVENKFFLVIEIIENIWLINRC